MYNVTWHEINFKSGDVFEMLEEGDPHGWFYGKRQGIVGMYPRQYVEYAKGNIIIYEW